MVHLKNGVEHGRFSDFDLPVQFEVLNMLYLTESYSAALKKSNYIQRLKFLIYFDGYVKLYRCCL